MDGSGVDGSGGSTIVSSSGSLLDVPVVVTVLLGDDDMTVGFEFGEWFSWLKLNMGYNFFSKVFCWFLCVVVLFLFSSFLLSVRQIRSV
jgi:hypothetical protein